MTLSGMQAELPRGQKTWKVSKGLGGGQDKAFGSWNVSGEGDVLLYLYYVHYLPISRLAAIPSSLNKLAVPFARQTWTVETPEIQGRIVVRCLPGRLRPEAVTCPLSPAWCGALPLVCCPQPVHAFVNSPFTELSLNYCVCALPRAACRDPVGIRNMYKTYTNR